MGIQQNSKYVFLTIQQSIGRLFLLPQSPRRLPLYSGRTSSPSSRSCSSRINRHGYCQFSYLPSRPCHHPHLQHCYTQTDGIGGSSSVLIKQSRTYSCRHSFPDPLREGSPGFLVWILGIPCSDAQSKHRLLPLRNLQENSSSPAQRDDPGAR